MSWAGDYDQTSDFSSIGEYGLLYQIFYAIAERMKAKGSTAWPQLPPVGCKCFIVSSNSPPLTSSWPPTTGVMTATWSIRWAQDWCEANYSSFLNPATDWQGQTGIVGWTLSQIRSAAGLNASGFLRHYDWGYGGGVQTAYGKMQVGDLVCSHLFNEVKHMLQKMTKLVVSASWTNPGCRTVIGRSFVSMALAKADCATKWANGEGFGEGGNFPESGAVSAIAIEDGWALASWRRGRSKMTANLRTGLGGGSIDFYIKPDIDYPLARTMHWDGQNNFAAGDRGKYQFQETASFGDGDATKESADYMVDGDMTATLNWEVPEAGNYNRAFGWECQTWNYAGAPVVTYTMQYGAT